VTIQSSRRKLVHFHSHDFSLLQRLVNRPYSKRRWTVIVYNLPAFVGLTTAGDLAHAELRHSKRSIALAPRQSILIVKRHDHFRRKVKHPPRDQLMAGGVIDTFQSDQIPIALAAIAAKLWARQ
jgi:hypothetical protein